MKNKQKQALIATIQEKDPNDQLQMFRMLIDELSLNNESLDSNDNYDFDESLKIIKSLEDYLIKLNQKIENEKLKVAIEKFKQLNTEHKKKIISKFVPLILEEVQKQTCEETFNICQKEGHDFPKWEHNKYITYQRVCIDHQIIDNYPVTHESWSRKCHRCGFEETSEKEPPDLKKIRKDKRKKKELSNELDNQNEKYK